jgi:hypothetical protein
VSPTAGIVFAAALLIALAGVAKITRPAATQVALRTAGLPSSRPAAQLLGVVEVAIAVVALAVAGTAGAALVAASYLGFAAFSAQLLRRSRGTASCGCFGGDDAPVTRLHVWLNAVLAAAALLSLADPAPPIWEAAADTPWAGVPFVLLVLALAWLLLVALTVLPSVLATAARPAAPTIAGSAAPSAPNLTITTKPEGDR